MADQNNAIPLYAVRMRLTRLGGNGAPLVGADNLYVPETLVRYAYSPQYQTTDSVTKTNGAGGTCLATPAKSTPSGANITLELCDEDPYATEMLAGGSVLSAGSGSDIIGYQARKQNDPDPAPVAVELWVEAWHGDQQDGVLPWFWFCFPLNRLHMTDRELGASTDNKNFEGSASENAGFGAGVGAYPNDTSAYMQWVRTATPPPAPTTGYAPVAAPSS